MATVQTKLIPDFTDNALSVMLDPRRKFHVRLLADVEKGNMNGDPDRGGKPRVDPWTGRGLATDCCGKRILRDTMAYLLDNGYEVNPEPGDPYAYGQLYMSHKAILNKKHEDVYAACNISGYEESSIGVPDKLLDKLVVDGVPAELPNAAYVLRQEGEKKYSLVFDGSLSTEERTEAKAAFKKIDGGLSPLVDKLHKSSKVKVQSDENMAALTNKLWAMYQDVRWFGAVASTGNSCGNVKGPWQVGMGESYDVLEVVNMAITCDAVRRIEDADIKRQDMGRKDPTPYALYKFDMTFHPYLAARMHPTKEHPGGLGTTAEDLRLFWTSLYNFGEFLGSSMRGKIRPAGIYVFAHDHPLGCCHDYALYERIKVVRNEDVKHARYFRDYEVVVDDHDMPEGVTLIKFLERVTTTTPPAPQGALLAGGGRAAVNGAKAKAAAAK